MKLSAGETENGVVVGNTYDKYGSKNFIVRWIMRGFEYAVDELVNQTNPLDIHEIGCGEGYWVLRWNQQNIKARGSDFSERVISIARMNAAELQLPGSLFETLNIYDVAPERDAADLIVCCEVLEHLENPDAGLRALQGITTNRIILSVPREPLWRILNLVRGKYITGAGNTPGHIQHWSKRKFICLVSKYFDIIEVKCPLPWTILLCQKKNI